MTVIQGLLRSVPFFVIFLLVRLLPIPADVVGENVRLGLLVFGLTGLACSIWALVDVLSLPLLRTITQWLVTAIVIALAQPVLGRWESPGGYTQKDAWSDLMSLSIFMFGMVLLPAGVVALATHRWLFSEETNHEATPVVSDVRERARAKHLPGRHGPKHQPSQVVSDVRERARAKHLPGRHGPKHQPSQVVSDVRERARAKHLPGRHGPKHQPSQVVTDVREHVRAKHVPGRPAVALVPQPATYVPRHAAHAETPHNSDAVSRAV